MTDNNGGYGLGRYYDFKGCMWSYDLEYATDYQWYEGHSRDKCAIKVNFNACSKSVVVGNKIRFKSWDGRKTISVIMCSYDWNLYIRNQQKKVECGASGDVYGVLFDIRIMVLPCKSTFVCTHSY